MLVDRRLVFEQTRFLSPVRHRHDVHVLELGPAFAPITVRQNMMAPDFRAGLHFTPGWDGPVKEPVKSRYPHTASGGFHMLEKGRETADHLPAIERFCDRAKFFE